MAHRIEMVSLDVLGQYKQKGLIRSRRHPSLPISIYNYTELTQYTGAWDDVTATCRALVLDDDGAVVARSFPKFHNLAQGRHTATDQFEVFEKLDGSLILLFYYHGEWQVASRGSFDSEQANEARAMLPEKYDVGHLQPSLCYSFEILYPENRIVVDYGGRRELVFLAAFDRDGVEAEPLEDVVAAGFRCVRRFDNIRDVGQIMGLGWRNAEGCVVRFSNGERVKVKFEEYCRLHKVATNLNEGTVWEWFRGGQDVQHAVTTHNLPDEWHAWLRQTFQALQAAYDAVLARVQTRVRDLQGLGTRKDQARAVVADPDRKLIFLALDGKDLHDAICLGIKPAQPQTAPRRRPMAQPGTTGSVLMLCGISASGKSSWASQEIRTSAGASVAVSRDGLRRMLFGYGLGDMTDHYSQPHLEQREELVTAVERAALRAALAQGKRVIVDDTNLSQRTVNGLLKHVPEYEVGVKLFETDLQEAILRDAARPDRVGEAIVRAQHAKLQALKRNNTLQSRPRPEPIAPPAAGLPTAFVFDMDGTLAHNTTRHPFDWSRVHEDTVDMAVHAVLEAVRAAGHRIIVCTARDSCCEQATRDWLTKHRVLPERLYMRPHDDSRPDYAVKESFWRDIAASYRVMALVDDRDSVVWHARGVGLKVLQAAPGDF